MSEVRNIDAAIKVIHEDVVAELYASMQAHQVEFASAHEGHSVIREEFEELWEHVKADTGYSEQAYNEAMQLAAMAMKFMLTAVLRGARERE